MRPADGLDPADDGGGGPGGDVDTVNDVAPVDGNVSLTATDIPSTGPSTVQADLDALKYIESASDLQARFPAAGGVHTIDQGSEWRLPVGATEIDITPNTIVGVFPGGVSFVGAHGRIKTDVNATLASGELDVKNVTFNNANVGAAALCVDFSSLFGRTLRLSNLGTAGIHPGRVANSFGGTRLSEFEVMPTAAGSTPFEIDGSNGLILMTDPSVDAPGGLPYRGISVLATASLGSMSIQTGAIIDAVPGDALLYVDPAVTLPPTSTISVTGSVKFGPGDVFDAAGLGPSDPEIFSLNNINAPSSRWLADVAYDSAGGDPITLNMSGGVEVMPSENAGPTAVAVMLPDSERFVTPLSITGIQDWEAISESRNDAIQGEVSWTATVRRNTGSIRQILGWVQYRTGPDPAVWQTIGASEGERPMGTLYERVGGSAPFQWDATYEFRLVIQGTVATLTDIKNWRLQIGQGRP